MTTATQAKPKPKDVPSLEVKIYWSEQYSRFSFMKGNRDLNESKIKRIIRDIEEGTDLLKYVPIVVDERYRILDGQHRFYVSKKLKRPVYYVVCPQISIQKVAKVNTNTSNWRLQDFLNCYVRMGIQDYKRVEEFMDLHKELKLGTAVQLLWSGRAQNGGGHMEAFREGDFQVKHWDEACELVEFAVDFKERVPHWATPAFLRAAYQLIHSEQYDHHTMAEKLAKDSTPVQKFSNYKDYLVELEMIYNKGNHKRVPIY